MVGTKTNIDDFCYYKCRDCGKRYLGYPPERCTSCGCNVFDFVLGEDFWGSKGLKVLETIRR